MSDIYEIHSKAFRGVTAYCVTDREGKHIARVAFTFSRSGLRTTCYFHIFGYEMTRVYASGGGYDKASAAAQSAVKRTKPAKYLPGQGIDYKMETIRDAIKDRGTSWDQDLRDAGFNVLQAV